MSKYINLPYIALLFLLLFAGKYSYADPTPTPTVGFPQGFSPQKVQTLSFRENLGQVYDQNYQARQDVLFSGTDGAFAYHLKKTGISYQLNRVDSWKKAEIAASISLSKDSTQMIPDQSTIYRLDVNWLNANTQAAILKGEPLAGEDNFYTAASPNGISHVKSYKEVQYLQLYSGIDLKWYEKDGKLKYDYIVSPCADYKQIQLEIKGALSIHLNKKGELIIKTPLGDLMEQAPIVFQKGKQFPAKWIIQDEILSFEVEGIDFSQTFTIDPAVQVWGTYYGGSGYDDANSCTLDNAGNVYLAGSTACASPIATSGAHQVSLLGTFDDYLVKFNSAGVRQWATYYGGSGDEGIGGVKVDASGNIYFCGVTNSTSGIATAGSHQTTLGGGNDGFLVKFNNSGVRLWATYYGGTNQDYCTGGQLISIDAFGNLYLGGYTQSTNAISTVGAHQVTSGGGQDAFLVKFNSLGVRQWASYFGGTGIESIYECTNDDAGNLYIVGVTESSSNIATVGAHQSTLSGSRDGYLAKFSGSGVRIWGTYYGGTGIDAALSCCVDNSGFVYIAGSTESPTGTGIATVGSHQTNSGGGEDGFLAKFSTSGVRQWGTFYGGTGGDQVMICRVDITGAVYITGIGNNNGIATYGPSFGGAFDAYLALFNSAGARQWSTYFGGAGGDYGQSMTLDNYGNVYFCGSTFSSTGIATAGAHKSTYGGSPNCDGYLAKFRNLPEINIQGNSITIVDADATPSISDGSDFGDLSLGNSLIHSFTIQNLESGIMYIDSMKVTGANAGYYAIYNVPSMIAGFSSATFTLILSPTLAKGDYSAVVHIYSNDLDESHYDFAIGGYYPGTVLNLDGTNDYINGTIPQLPQGNTARTIEGWYKGIDMNGTIFNYGTSTSNALSGISMINGDIYYTGQGNDLSSGITISDDNWHHVAAAFDGTKLRLYIDGILKAESPKTFATSGTSFRMGQKMSPLGGDFLSGTIDGIRVWNRALSQCEIQHKMNCESPTTNTGLVANFHFNKGIANEPNVGVTSLTNSINNGNGTLNNFGLTGTGSNWTNQGVITTGSVCPAYVVPTNSLLCAYSNNYVQTTQILAYDASGNLMNVQETGTNPNVTITGDSLICEGETVVLTASGGIGATYSWHHGGNTATTQVQPAQTTLYQVTVMGLNGCTSLKKWWIHVNPKPNPGIITGDTIPITGTNYLYSLPTHVGSFYAWHVSEGSLIAGFGLAQASINWFGDTTGMIKIVETNYQGCKSDTLYRPIVFSKTQSIPLQTGWNLISTYLHLANPTLPTALQNISSQWLEMRDENYSFVNDPQWYPFNTLTGLTDGQGYWLKASTPCTLSLSGLALRPSQVQIPLQTGWNLIGYTGQYSKLTQNAFASIMPNVVMIKNTFQSYNPAYNPGFNTLTSIQPGVGYWVNVNAPVVFTYPAPDPSGIRLDGDSIYAPADWKPIVYTGSMVAYGKVTLNDKQVQAGDVIGAFVKGECRAIAAVNNEEGFSLVSMVLNGMNKDTIEFRLFHDNQYYVSDFHTEIIADKNITDLLPITFRGLSTLPDNLMEVYPNPVSNHLAIHLHLADNEIGILSLFDALGKSIFETKVSGTQVWEWKVPESLATGIYQLRLQAGDKQTTQKIILER